MEARGVAKLLEIHERLKEFSIFVFLSINFRNSVLIKDV